MVPTKWWTYVYTVPTEPTSVHTVATAWTQVCIMGFVYVYHYHDCENEKIDTNIFFCNVF